MEDRGAMMVLDGAAAAMAALDIALDPNRVNGLSSGCAAGGGGGGGVFCGVMTIIC